MAMVWWMCNMTLNDRKPSNELEDHLGLLSIRNCIQGGLDKLKE